MSEACSLWDRIWTLPEPEDSEKEFRSRSRLSGPWPKAGAHLLAFAYVAGAKLVTFDQALKSRGGNVRSL